MLPASFSSAFAHEREWPVLVNEHKPGEPETGLLGNPSWTRWRLVKRLTPSQMATLLQFWKDRNGGLEPFYFYDSYEINPRLTSDPTGAATVGLPLQPQLSTSRIEDGAPNRYVHQYSALLRRSHGRPAGYHLLDLATVRWRSASSRTSTAVANQHHPVQPAQPELCRLRRAGPSDGDLCSLGKTPLFEPDRGLAWPDIFLMTATRKLEPGTLASIPV